jgi:hypothetical protein
MGAEMNKKAEKGALACPSKLNLSSVGVVFAAVIACGHQIPDPLAFEHGFTPQTLQGASRPSASDWGSIPLILILPASWPQQLLVSLAL